MRRLKGNRDGERGVSAVIFAVMAVMLLAATGLGVDTGNLALQDSRVQHSADAAAFAIAYDCIAKDEAKCSSGGGAATASYFATENAAGGSGSIVGALSTASTQVKVSVTKPVSTYFMNVVGIGSRTADNTATAQWSKHVTGGNVIPFGISLCEYINAGAGQTFIRTDVEEKVIDQALKPSNLTSAVYPKLSPNMVTNCAVPEGSSLPGNPAIVNMLKGGLWLSDNGSSTNNGKLIETHILDTLNGGHDFQMNQPGKFEKYFAVDQTMLMAIYAPNSNYTHGGLKTTGSGATEKTDGEISLRLIGYAPFKPTAWCLGSGCGSQGFSGKFIGTALDLEEAEATYGTTGANFGAVKVELIK